MAVVGAGTSLTWVLTVPDWETLAQPTFSCPKRTLSMS